MKVKFLSGFEKDLKRIKDKEQAKTMLECIRIFEEADQLSQIPNIKKMKGHSTAYRYRKGKYRIGFYYENDTVIFAAFAPRDKIYKRFP